jgi:hypothetical protein
MRTADCIGANVGSAVKRTALLSQPARSDEQKKICGIALREN